MHTYHLNYWEPLQLPRSLWMYLCNAFSSVLVDKIKTFIIIIFLLSSETDSTGEHWEEDAKSFPVQQMDDWSPQQSWVVEKKLNWSNFRMLHKDLKKEKSFLQTPYMTVKKAFYRHHIWLWNRETIPDRINFHKGKSSIHWFLQIDTTGLNMPNASRPLTDW